jgi:hypothetical protein
MCSVDLKGDTEWSIKHAKRIISPKIMTASTGADLFALIAQEIDHFVKLTTRIRLRS